MRWSRALWAAGVVAGIVAAPRPARAQSAGDKAAAEALFDEGRKLFVAKKYADACPRFEASERLDPGIGTLLYLADCYENVGKAASAWATFREAASLAKAAGQADRERVARERAKLLEPKLYRLTLKVEPTPGVKVSRNDTELKAETWNAALPVDPGTYTFTATAPGKKPWSTRLTIPTSAGAQEISVPALDDDPNAKQAAAPPAPEEKAPPGPPPEPPGRAQRIAGIVVGSVGVIGLAIGAGLAPVASSKFSTAKTTCPAAPCSDKTGVDLAHDAVMLADGATAAFVVGGAALAAGVITFFTAPSARPAAEKTTGRAWIVPVVAPGTAGLAGGVTFR